MTQAIEEQGLVGVGKVAIRERERLCTLRVSGPTMVVETMHWPEEIRDAKFEELHARAQVQERERKMARQLIKELAEDFEPSRFKDQYHSALQKLIKRKIKGEDIVVPQKAEESPGVTDLMDALRASVDAAKRGEKARPQKVPRRRASSAHKRDKDDLVTLDKPKLVERARKLGIEGRSKMSKNELAQAIRRAS
jgi:DNA end-binding protein Ku